MIVPRRIPLAQTPTPLIPLRRLSNQLAGGDMWIKRDDLTGFELSGNKIRKIEYIAAAAMDDGHNAIVTEGTPQSNHCRATAAACARLGLHCKLLLRPRPSGAITGNHFLDALFNAEIATFDRPDFDNRRDEIVAHELADLAQRGLRPRWTPMGASEPLGCWGYITMMEELARQVRDAGFLEADVVCAISSGGTYAGLLLGRAVHRASNLTIHAVPVSDDIEHHRRNVLDLCDRAAQAYRLPGSIDAADLHWIDGYVGEGYAIPYAAALAAIRLLASVEGIVLDPVYSAKAFCALLDLVRDGKLGRERPVIFVHTGGGISNFAWAEQILREPPLIGPGGSVD